MLKRFRKAAGLGLAAAVVMSVIAYADGIYQTYPQVGGASFCASTVSGVVLPAGQGPYGVVPGTTQGSGTQGICQTTVPAGPLLFTGFEHFPVDVNQLGTTANGAPPATANVLLTQLGNGAYLDLTTVTTQTIPNGVSQVFMDGAQANNYTLTMPPNPSEGTLINFVCEKATSGALNVVANTGQTMVTSGNPSTACVIFNNYTYRYILANTTWYRVH